MNRSAQQAAGWSLLLDVRRYEVYGATLRLPQPVHLGRVRAVVGCQALGDEGSCGSGDGYDRLHADELLFHEYHCAHPLHGPEHGRLEIGRRRCGRTDPSRRMISARPRIMMRVQLSLPQRSE